MNFVATFALLVFSTSTGAVPDSVRISLFTLFKPETLQVRVASGEAAVLESSGRTDSRRVSRSELIQISLSGNRLNTFISGSHAAIKQSGARMEVRITPVSSATLELILPGKIKREVRGAISVDAGPGGRGPLRILLTTDRESAVASIVAAETSRREPEALKALAVVVRTFMISQSGRHSGDGFDFCDTTHCQVYRGEQDLSDTGALPAVTEAVDQTRGQTLRFEGGVVDAYYSAACGGISATPAMVWGGNSRYPYGRIACQWCRGSRFSRWERSASAARVLASISAFTGSNLSSATDLVIDCDRTDGLVRSVTMRDGIKKTVLSADGFRRAIGLQLGWNTVLSPTFTVERRGSRLIFRGRGFGSQVGLCEAGAVAQAVAGRNYREILGFYYPAARVSEQAANE
ncbi:MAG: SpoIID/LytB domain-containing protein [Blastocatellia bacterium]